MLTALRKVKGTRRRARWEIVSYPSEANQCDMFYVYINGQYITAYLTREAARRKIFNHITRYKYCEVEPKYFYKGRYI